MAEDPFSAPEATVEDPSPRAAVACCLRAGLAGALLLGLAVYLVFFKVWVYAHFEFSDGLEVVIHDGGDLHEMAIVLQGEVRQDGVRVSQPADVLCLDFDEDPTFAPVAAAGGRLVGVTVQRYDRAPDLILLYDRERGACYPRYGDYWGGTRDPEVRARWQAAFRQVAREHPEVSLPW